MSPRSDLPASGLLGLGGGMRTFAPPAVSVLSGRSQPSQRIRRLLLAAAVGELVADKIPAAPSRWSVAGLAPRVGLSGWGGYQVAGSRGVPTAAAAALVAAFAGSRLRTSGSGSRHRLLAAVAEDLLSYGLVFAAVHRG